MPAPQASISTGMPSNPQPPDGPAPDWLNLLRPRLGTAQRRASRLMLVCCFGALVGGLDILSVSHARAIERFEPPAPRPVQRPTLARRGPSETAIRNPRLSPTPRPRLAPVIRDPDAHN